MGKTTKALEVIGLQTHFQTRRGIGKAVDGVSFSISPGETLGLVGESGSGKSLTAQSILRVHPRPAAKIVGGEVLYHGEDLLQLAEPAMRRVRGSGIAMILQDPTSTLNPCFTIGHQLFEVLKLHRSLRGKEMKKEAARLLDSLRIPDAVAQLKRYPHQLSGGMRQRVVGAIALAGRPKVLIADEPTTALDVTIQAGYLELLKSLQSELGFAMLFISHDFGVISRVSDRVAVMYAGKIVEEGSKSEIFNDASHPYTQALIESVSDVEDVPERLSAIRGQPPSIYSEVQGCSFAPRCPMVESVCEHQPPAFQIGEGRKARCWIGPFEHGSSQPLAEARLKDAN